MDAKEKADIERKLKDATAKRDKVVAVLTPLEVEYAALALVVETRRADLKSAEARIAKLTALLGAE